MTTKVLAEDGSAVYNPPTDVLAEEEEDMTRLREWIWILRRRWSDNALEESTTTTFSSVEEDGPKGSETTKGALLALCVSEVV